MTDQTTQAEYWSGEAGDHWVAEQERYDASGEPFGLAAIDALGDLHGTHVLDIGCGCGATSVELARRGAEVVGIDVSPQMLRRASERAQGLAIRFVLDDAQTHRFEPGSFDAAISRFGVMFFDDPVAAFTNIRGALRPDGRLAFVCWADPFRNEWISVPAAVVAQHVPLAVGEPGAPSPFAFADTEHVRTILTAAGFADVGFEEVVRPMRLGSDVADTIAFLRTTGFAQRMLANANPDEIDTIMDDVAVALAPYAGPDGVRLTGTAWLVSARPGGR